MCFEKRLPKYTARWWGVAVIKITANAPKTTQIEIEVYVNVFLTLKNVVCHLLGYKTDHRPFSITVWNRKK
jgi:hypothetical protein